MMEKNNFPEDVPLSAKMVSNSIEKAQRQVENMNFEARKNVLEYDDVMNQQRLAIYKERDAIIGGDDLQERIDEIITDTIWYGIDEFCPEKTPSAEWAWASIDLWYEDITDGDEWFKDFSDTDDIEFEELVNLIKQRLVKLYEEKVKLLGDAKDKIERIVLINMLDTHWKNHLLEMDYVKSAAWMRSMGQRDPLTEYKNEAYSIFERLTENMYDGFLKIILHMQIENTNIEMTEEEKREEDNTQSVKAISKKDIVEAVYRKNEAPQNYANNIKQAQNEKIEDNRNEMEKALEAEFVPPNDDEIDLWTAKNITEVKEYFDDTAVEDIFDKAFKGRDKDNDYKPEHLRTEGQFTTLSTTNLDGFSRIDNTESQFIPSELNVEHIISESKSSALPKKHVHNSDTTSSKTGKRKIGRNDPCPCGSGKKYKRCCGR